MSCSSAAAISGETSRPASLVDKREQRDVHGLVFPLITTATGSKFGKTEAGNIWLDPEKTSPYHFYQFWVNTDDRDVERYLKLFTFLRLDRIGTTMEQHVRDPGKRLAQKLLAREVTSMVHGESVAEQAKQTSEALFAGKAGTGEDVIAEMPERRVSRAQMPPDSTSSTCCWRAASPAPRPMPGAGSRGRGSTSTASRSRAPTSSSRTRRCRVRPTLPS